mmetsp:Transcript_26494/g.41088  ORF Transcript_26494/g.41088 Transcript_26494/m.41088 type:complete len:336 (+) Transcript_26494:61-1068(+)
MNVFNCTVKIIPRSGTAGIRFAQYQLGVLSRTLSTAVGSSGEKHSSIKLYQYQICPFCNKVKALLDYSRTPYESIEVNPLTKSELKKDLGVEYTKVPIAVIDGKQVNGSKEIIEEIIRTKKANLEARWAEEFERLDVTVEAKSDIVPFDEFDFETDESAEWLEWADDELAALLYPNLCRTFSDSYKAFSYVDEVPHFSAMQRISIKTVGGFAMWMAASKVKKRMNIQDEREALEYALNVWEGSGLNERRFNSGWNCSPNLSDIVVYGVLRSVEGMNVFDEVIVPRKRIFRWYKDMRSFVDPNQKPLPFTAEEIDDILDDFDDEEAYMEMENRKRF